VATTTSNLSLLRTETGEIIWTISFAFPVSDTPVISHDDNFVYVTTEDGVISALSIETGDEVWSIMCEDIQGVTTNVSVSVSRAVVTCVDLIDAKSSLSPNGLVFFYGDKYGNVKALQLGVPTIPTAAPSEIPAFPPTGSPSVSPSASPTGGPSLSPSPTALRPTHAPIDWPELFMDDNSKKSAASPATGGGSTVIVTSTFLFCSMTMMMIFVRD
jgi:PQQ-like domain